MEIDETKQSRCGDWYRVQSNDPVKFDRAQSNGPVKSNTTDTTK